MTKIIPVDSFDCVVFVATGDLTPDDDLPNMTDAMLGVVTAHHYSALHDSPLNKEFVAAY